MHYSASMCVCVCFRIIGCTSFATRCKRMSEWVSEWVSEWEHTDNTPTDGQTDGRTDGRTDGGAEERNRPNGGIFALGRGLTEVTEVNTQLHWAEMSPTTTTAAEKVSSSRCCGSCFGTRRRSSRSRRSRPRSLTHGLALSSNGVPGVQCTHTRTHSCIRQRERDASVCNLSHLPSFLHRSIDRPTDRPADGRTPTAAGRSGWERITACGGGEKESVNSPRNGLAWSHSPFEPPRPRRAALLSTPCQAALDTTYIHKDYRTCVSVVPRHSQAGKNGAILTFA